MTTKAVCSITPVATNANFQAWVNEIYNALVTTCGLSVHTADTGQMAAPCTTNRFAADITYAADGYYMFKFNDTLQATSPIFIKLEFGMSLATTPALWITMATSWLQNGIIGNGCIKTLGAITAGSGLNGGASGVFTVVVTAGSGLGCVLSVTLTSGAVTAASIVNPGQGYLSTDSLTITPAMIVAAGGAAGGSNGAVAVGTISSGQLSTNRCAMTSGTLIPSTTLLSESWYVYNSTYGFFTIVWKNPEAVQANYCCGGAVITRSNNTSTGAATGDAAVLMTNGWNSAAVTAQAGAMTTISYLTSALLPATPSLAGCTAWAPSCVGYPMSATQTYSTSNSYECCACPQLIETPAIQVSAYMGWAILSEASVSDAVNATLSAGLSLTFLSVGIPFGLYNGVTSYMGWIAPVTTLGNTMLILWQ